MKPITYISLLLVILFTACSKKKANIDVDPGGPVTINGTSYPTVKIGNQTWTSVNYNGPGGINYNNSQVNDPVYGKLYTYIEAENISLPTGWHLPTQSDFVTLFNTFGVGPNNQNYYLLPDSTARKLMSTTTWFNEVGNNKTGFNAVGTGVAPLGSSLNFGLITDMLTSSKFPNGYNVSFDINEYLTSVIAELNAATPNDTDRGSLRFVKSN